MQALLFLLSVASGVRIIYVVNRASWMIVLRQVSTRGLDVMPYIHFGHIAVPPFGYCMGVHHSATEAFASCRRSGFGCGLDESLRDEDHFLSFSEVNAYILYS
jgi:hypothetical protein